MTKRQMISQGGDAVRVSVDFEGNDDETNLTDTLTNLRHWADANDVDFYRALDSSYEHYLVEKDTPLDEEPVA
jgi:hypothetical protein